jgi:uncharacterized protein (TIGR03435 family)
MRRIPLLVTASLMLLAQEKPAFEVASIRISQQDDGQDIDSYQGLFRAHNVTARRLMALAYTLDMSEIVGGPKWLDSDRYDINAKIPAELAEQRPSRLPEMIESLLAERFQIQIHREQRQMPGYALVLDKKESKDKKGSKLQSSKTPEKGSDTHSNGRHLTATNVSMERFAQRLSREVMGVVVDRTGLKGGFDFELDWTPEKFALAAVPDAADGAPSIFVALPEQLGLRLESTKVAVSAVIVDRAEKPTTD